MRATSATTPGGAAGPATALPSLVDALVGAPLDTLDVGALQEQIADVTPQVFRLQGWLQTAAGRPEQRTGGTLPADDTSRKRSVAGWLADVQHGTPGTSGATAHRTLAAQPASCGRRRARRLLTPAQAAVLTRLVGKIDEPALVESQPELIAVAAAMDPQRPGVERRMRAAYHADSALPPRRC